MQFIYTQRISQKLKDGKIAAERTTSFNKQEEKQKRKSFYDTAMEKDVVADKVNTLFFMLQKRRQKNSLNSLKTISVSIKL